MSQRKCDNCGAPLPRDGYVCAYCNTDWTPDSPEFGKRPKTPAKPIVPPPQAKPAPPPRPKKKPPKDVVIFVVLLVFCCWPGALVYLWAGTAWERRVKWILTAAVIVPMVVLFTWFLFDINVNRIDGVGEKITADAPAMDDRAYVELAPGSVYQRMIDVREKERESQRKLWREQFEGKWVQWIGVVETRSTYSGIPSHVTIRVHNKASFKIKVYFDPAHKAALGKLRNGDTVQVSGRLWGFSCALDEIELADGLFVVVVDEKKDVDPVATKPGRQFT
ncbi:MAG: hypothetical protein P9L99_09385 [Candidatus Lernaella stagnicola]|nr:hypothetical protein [Candidatus Lernaella stagnicola]